MKNYQIFIKKFIKSLSKYFLFKSSHKINFYIFLKNLQPKFIISRFVSKKLKLNIFIKRWKTCFLLVGNRRIKKRRPVLIVRPPKGRRRGEYRLGNREKTKFSEQWGILLHVYMHRHKRAQCTRNTSRDRGTAIFPLPLFRLLLRFSTISIPRLMRQFYNLPPVSFPTDLHYHF